MNRRGVAMIFVLAASVVLLSAAAIVARVRATAMLIGRTTDSLTMALEVCDASDAAVLEWLRTESREAVLNPNVQAPALDILSDVLQFGDRRITVEITGWDQAGMVPGIDLDALPSLQRYTNGIRANELRTSTLHPGLDTWPTTESVFPSRSRPGATGGLIATHSPHPSSANRRGGDIPSLNINTATEPVLRAVFQDLSIDGLELILAARRRGEQATLEGIRSGVGTPIRLVSSSSAWSFRTDITIDGPGHAVVSVWSVYCLRGGTWIREQRFVITD